MSRVYKKEARYAYEKIIGGIRTRDFLATIRKLVNRHSHKGTHTEIVCMVYEDLLSGRYDKVTIPFDVAKNLVHYRDGGICSGCGRHTISSCSAMSEWGISYKGVKCYKLKEYILQCHECTKFLQTGVSKGVYHTIKFTELEAEFEL